MAEYIKREMPDMNGTGEKKAYYKVKTYSNLSSQDFVKKICYPGSGLNQGDVAKVMCRMVNEMKCWLAEGHTVTIDELGTFSLSIGVIDDDEVEDPPPPLHSRQRAPRFLRPANRHHIGRTRKYEGVCEARAL